MHRILDCLYCANASEGIASLKMFMLRGELGHEARTGRYLMTVPKKKKKRLQNSLKLGSNSQNGG